MGLTRQLLLAASQSRWLREEAPRYRFMRAAVSRFLPGEGVDAALAAARLLQAKGVSTILTELGESVVEPTDGREAVRNYVDLVDRLSVLGVDAQLSVKLTQLGLSLSEDECRTNLTTIVEHAARAGILVAIDMESSCYTDLTIELFRRVRANHPNLGICLQASLSRTAYDLTTLLHLGPAVRLVKGGYSEPHDRALAGKNRVRANYLALASQLLSEDARQLGVRPAFATHDRRLIQGLTSMAATAGVPKQAFEFQMLYGIRCKEQERLVRDGYRVRVLISYGVAWFPWFTRRLAERPANVLSVLRSVVAGQRSCASNRRERKRPGGRPCCAAGARYPWVSPSRLVGFVHRPRLSHQGQPIGTDRF